MKSLSYILGGIMLATIGAFGQTYAAFPVLTPNGIAIAGANVALCQSQPTLVTPCGGSALQQTYSDITLGTQCTLNSTILGPTYGTGCTNPGLADGFGIVRLYVSSLAGTPTGYLSYQTYNQGIVTTDVEPIMFPGGGSGPGSSKWSSLLDPTQPLSLNLPFITTFTSTDYGASPVVGVTNYTSPATSSTDTSYEVAITAPPTSYHNPLYIGVDGFAQLQVCNTDGSQHVGIILMGSAIPCNNLSISPISKNWLTAQTPAHTVDTLFHSATNENGTLFQMHSASAAGVNFDFARACTGASAADGSCPSGNNQWRVHSDGSTYQNGSGNFGATPPTALPAGANGTACGEGSTAGTPTTGQDYFRCSSTFHGLAVSNNGGTEFAIQPSPALIVGTGISRWGAGDIGSQVNAALATLPNSCGEIAITAGTFSQTTPIVKPRCVRLHGAAGYGTILNWSTPSGWAIVAGDNTGATLYPEGGIEDIFINGDGGSSGGIYIGGDPTAAISPSNYFGDHQNFNRVHVQNFNTAVGLGNNSWSITFFESILNANTNGFIPSNSLTNSGESINFVNTTISNNTALAIGSNGTFAPNIVPRFTGSSIDFNGNGSTAPIQGGFVSVNSHFEQTTGPIFDTTTFGGFVADAGSLFVLHANTGCFGNLATGQALSPNSFIASEFYSSVSSVADIICNTKAAVNLVGIQLLGTNVASSRGTNYVTGAFTISESQFGSSYSSNQIYCESTGGGITTLNTGAATTNTGLNCLPANSIIDAVVYRITTTITTAASFTIGDATTAARFCGTQSTLTSGTTGTCFVQADQTGAAGPRQTGAAAVRVTTNANPGAGAIRLIVYYHTWTPPTS